MALAREARTGKKGADARLARGKRKAGNVQLANVARRGGQLSSPDGSATRSAAQHPKADSGFRGGRQPASNAVPEGRGSRLSQGRARKGDVKAPASGFRGGRQPASNNVSGRNKAKGTGRGPSSARASRSVKPARSGFRGA